MRWRDGDRAFTPPFHPIVKEQLERRMISPSQVESMIKQGLPDAQVQIQDLTGGGDHYQAIVVSSHFAGKNLVQQHQLVYGTLREAMATEAIHALALKTYTPEAWAAAQPSA